MEKKICSYELLFAISGNLSEEDYKTLCDKFVNLINANASDVTVNEWGKRRLAYPINYITEGYYVLVSFKSEPSFPLELERVLGITEGVIVYKIYELLAKSLVIFLGKIAADREEKLIRTNLLFHLDNTSLWSFGHSRGKGLDTIAQTTIVFYHK